MKREERATELFWQKEERIRTEGEREGDREREKSLIPPQIQYWVCYCECVHCRKVLFSMAGTVFGRLSLEEGDSANSLEGLDIKLRGEGKTLPAGCVRDAGWFIIQTSSLACVLSHIRLNYC